MESGVGAARDGRGGCDLCGAAAAGAAERQTE